MVNQDKDLSWHIFRSNTAYGSELKLKQGSDVSPWPWAWPWKWSLALASA